MKVTSIKECFKEYCLSNIKVEIEELFNNKFDIRCCFFGYFMNHTISVSDNSIHCLDFIFFKLTFDSSDIKNVQDISNIIKNTYIENIKNIPDFKIALNFIDYCSGDLK